MCLVLAPSSCVTHPHLSLNSLSIVFSDYISTCSTCICHCSEYEIFTRLRLSLAYKYLLFLPLVFHHSLLHRYSTNHSLALLSYLRSTANTLPIVSPPSIDWPLQHHLGVCSAKPHSFADSASLESCVGNSGQQLYQDVHKRSWNTSLSPTWLTRPWGQLRWKSRERRWLLSRSRCRTWWWSYRPASLLVNIPPCYLSSMSDY